MLRKTAIIACYASSIAIVVLTLTNFCHAFIYATYFPNTLLASKQGQSLGVV